MKFLKTFLGLFFALFIPLMLIVGFLMKPKDVSTGQAIMGAALPLGSILLILSLGFAGLSSAMDKQNKPK